MGARFATGVVFLVVGWMFGTWAARLPAVKERLELSDAALSVALFSLEAGAVLGLSLGGRLVNRWGSRGVLRWSLPLFAVLLVVLGIAPDLVVLSAGTALWACVNSVVDVAMNAQGLAVQEREGRSVLSGLHAMHPIGGVLGAGAGSLAATADVAPVAHFAVAAAVVIGAAVLVVPWLVGDATPAGDTPRGGLTWSRPLVMVGLLAFCLTFAEGGVSNWAAIHLRESLAASPGLAGVAVGVFLLAVAAGRLRGDQLVRRFGAVAVFRIAALVGGIGLAVGLLTGTVAGALAGFAFLGLGLSVTMPITISAAGELGTGTAAQAVATVSTMAYLGSFVAPAVIGTIASVAHLGLALLVPAVLVVVLVPFARRLGIGQMARSRSAQ
jgi:MFS family permease